MLLNHLPFSFSAREFTGFSVPYESASNLKRLRQELTATHFCYRDHERILLFPHEQGTETEGKQELFSIIEHFGIANALARQALLRRFEASDRNISGFNPVSFV